MPRWQLEDDLRRVAALLGPRLPAADPDEQSEIVTLPGRPDA